MTNGGQLYTTGAAQIGNARSNSTLTVGGGGSIWNAGSQALTVGTGTATGNVLRIDGQAVAGGAVVTNTSTLDVGKNSGANGNELQVVAGGRLFTSGATVVGTSSTGNTVRVEGAGSLWNASATAITIGSGAGAQSNRLVIDGNGISGGAVVSNINAFKVGNVASANATVITNGGFLHVGAGDLVIGNAGFSNTLVVVGGAGAVSMIEAGSQIIRVGYVNGSNNTVLVDGRGVEGGAVITNGGVLVFGDVSLTPALQNRLIVTNGGVLYIGGARIGSAVNSLANSYPAHENQLIVAEGGRVISTSTVSVAYDAYGNTPMTLNKLLVTGTNAILDMGGTNIVVASGYAGVGGSSNSFEINGGLVTNVGAVSIASTWYNEVFKYSRLLITNGGRLYSSQASTIVPVGNSYNNTVEVYGSNSIWLLGGGNLAIGTATGGTNNTLTIDQGGTVDAIGTLTVATTNRVFLKSGLLGALAMTDNSLSLFTVGTGASSATLKALGGTLLFNSGLTINTNATLTGVGTVSGGSVGVTLTNGAILSPGLASAGTVTIGGSNLTWAGGGIYSCEITNLTLGFGVGWDVVNVSSQLVFTGTTPKFIKMDSKGVASGFNPALSYSLKILTYGGITGYDTNLITLDTSAFSTVPASTWYQTNVNNALWLVYDGLNPNGDANLVWKVPSNGVWSGAGNWVGGVAPTAGGDPTNVLSFGDNGTRYASTNNLTGTFQLNKLVLANMSGITNVICGSNLAFTVNGATAPRLEYQTGGGAFILSNAVSLGVGMTFGGDGGGTLVVASNVTGGQPLLKQGPWTLALANSNDFANPVVVTNGGIIRADNNKALGNNSIIVSDGGKLFSTPAFVFGSNAVLRSGQVTGSGSIWSNADLTISTNAVVTVENGGALMGKVSVASWGTVPYGLIVTNGGQVLAPGGGTLGGGSVTNSRILVTGPGSVFAGGATALTLGGTNNTLWADNGAVLTNLQTALIGVGNGIIVTNGSKFYTYASFQSLASGTNALTVITGTNSLLYLVGVVYIGAGGSNNEVRIENGAVSSRQAYNLSGESPGVSCRLVVNNATCYFTDDTKIGRTATMCGNQMIVTNGGQIYNLKASALTHVSYFGGSNNLLAVYAGSVHRMGPAGSPGSLRVGANANKVLIDGGTISDLSFLIGPGPTNLVNSIIVTNNGTLTLAASGSAIGNGVGCYSNWVYVGQGAKLDAQGFNLQIGAAAGCWNNWLEAGPSGLITNLGTLTIGVTANGTNFLLVAGGSVMANSLIATSALNTVNFSAGSLSVRSSSISNSLPFLVGDGSQTATLTLGGGTNQFIDGLVITNSATLAGNGIIQPGSTTVHGFLTPGGPGTMGALTNNGALRLTSSSVSVFKIATNTVAGAGWDLMVVTNGNLTLGGTLKPVLMGNYQPILTQSFVIMTNAGPLGISGDFVNGTNGAVIPAYNNDLIKVLGTFRLGISNQVVVLNSFLAVSSTERGTVFKVF